MTDSACFMLCILCCCLINSVVVRISSITVFMILEMYSRYFILQTTLYIHVASLQTSYITRPAPFPSQYTVGFSTEVGYVTAKCKGVIRYRLCHVLRAITFCSDDGLNLDRAITLRCDNGSYVPRAITFRNDNFAML